MRARVKVELVSDGFRDIMTSQAAQDNLKGMLDAMMAQLNARVPDGFVGRVSVSSGRKPRARATIHTASIHGKRAQVKYQLLERALNGGGAD